MNDMELPINDLVFSASDERIYVSSDKGLTAYDIASDLSLTPVADTELTTSLNHLALELTPDGCHY